jgi:hypothetical protein
MSSTRRRAGSTLDTGFNFTLGQAFSHPVWRRQTGGQSMRTTTKDRLARAAARCRANDWGDLPQYEFP